MKPSSNPDSPGPTSGRFSLEDIYQVLFEEAADGIIITYPEGRIVAGNPKAYEMTGYSAEELSAMTISDLMVSEDFQPHPFRLDDLRPGQVLANERQIHRKDGSLLPVEISSKVLPGGNRLSRIGDLRERRRTKDLMDQRIRELAALKALGLAVNASLSLDQVSAAALQNMQDAIQSDLTFLFLRQGERLVLKEVRAPEAQHRMDGFPEHRLGECLCGMAVQENRPIYSPDLRDDPRCTRKECKDAGIISFAALPLVSGVEIIGVIGLASQTERDFESQTPFLETLAHQISIALANARLYEGAQWDLAERRRVEESQIRLNAILENTSDLVSIATPDGQLTYLNQAGRAMVGWGKEESLTGRVIPDLHPEWALQKIETEGLPAAAALGLWEGETALLDRDGREIPVSQVILAHHSSDDVIQYFSTIMRDISERKRVEEALRESEERFRTAGKAAYDLIYEWEVTTDTLEWFGDIDGLLGYEKGVISRDINAWLGLIHPEDRVQLKDAVEVHRTSTKPIQYEYRIKHKDGINRYWVDRGLPLLDDKGHPYKWVGVCADITERKQAEEALLQSEARLSKTTENAPGMIFQFRLRPNGSTSFPYASAWCQDMFGISPETLREDSAPILDLIVPEDRPGFDDSVATSVQTMQHWRWEGRLRAANGQIVWHQGVSKPERQPDGSILWSGIFYDITDRKRVEAEKEKLQSQLIQSQKMESVARLAGGVAHDFNNMLSAILGHAELAMMQCRPSEPIQEDLKAIWNAAQRSADLTRQLLAFARKQIVSPKVLDLNDTVAGMLKMLLRLIGEDIDLVWKPDARLWPVKLDPSQIDQILVNLCVNARDAIIGVGKITIETAIISFDEEYCALHPGYSLGEYVLLAVSDNGCGMDKEIIDRLFEPFFTTKALGKGTGLGLATVYGIVKQIGGFINVYSEPGQGTTFKIYFPRFDGAALEFSSEPPVETPKGHGEMVLLVEDEAMILNMTRIMLKELGYEVLTAGTPGEALSKAKVHSAEMQLLITDVVMPEMNGRELARLLGEIKPGLKSLYTSGYTANVIAHHGVLDPDVHFLQKPFSLKDLAMKVYQVMKER